MLETLPPFRLILHWTILHQLFNRMLCYHVLVRVLIDDSYLGPDRVAQAKSNGASNQAPSGQRVFTVCDRSLGIGLGNVFFNRLQRFFRNRTYESLFGSGLSGLGEN